MFELESHEFDVSSIPRMRLPYAAVPLRPWSARYPGTDQLYSRISSEQIDQKARQAIDASEHFNAKKQTGLTNFILDSLRATHIDRMMSNHGCYSALDKLENPCDILQRAYEGLASPDELIEILTTYPELEALEIAKMSHPLDFMATEAMDDAVIEALQERDATVLATPARYKKKRLAPEYPAAILVRKLELGDIPATGGVIRVTRRQSLLVRGDEQVRRRSDVALPRLVKNDHRFDELTERVEKHLSSSDLDVTDQFLQPVTTSYYAKFVASSEEQLS